MTSWADSCCPGSHSMCTTRLSWLFSKMVFDLFLCSIFPPAQDRQTEKTRHRALCCLSVFVVLYIALDVCTRFSLILFLPMTDWLGIICLFLLCRESTFPSISLFMAIPCVKSQWQPAVSQHFLLVPLLQAVIGVHIGFNVHNDRQLYYLSGWEGMCLHLWRRRCRPTCNCKRLILRDVLSLKWRGGGKCFFLGKWLKKFMDVLAEKRGAAAVQRQLVCMILDHLLAWPLSLSLLDWGIKQQTTPKNSAPAAQQAKVREKPDWKHMKYKK